jgi:hypothetical protein
MLNQVEQQIAKAKQAAGNAIAPPDTFGEIEYGTEGYKKFVQHGEQFTQNITPQEWEEVYMYTTMKFDQINGELAKGQTSKDTDLLDSALSKTPIFTEPVRVFRGVKKLDRYVEGETVNFPNYISTSMSTKIAHDFAGDDGAVITFTTSTGAALNETTSEHGLGEKEILLPRNQKFKVVKIVDANYEHGYTTTTKKTIYLELE